MDIVISGSTPEPDDKAGLLVYLTYLNAIGQPYTVDITKIDGVVLTDANVFDKGKDSLSVFVGDEHEQALIVRLGEVAKIVVRLH